MDMVYKIVCTLNSYREDLVTLISRYSELLSEQRNHQRSREAACKAADIDLFPLTDSLP